MATPSSTVQISQGFDSSWLNDPLNHLVKAFVAFLQTIYEEAPRGYFHWSAVAEETEIAITEENPVRVEAIEQKPFISVMLGPVRFNGSSLDDLVNVSASTAKEIHTDLLPGTVTLNHVSRVPQEARFLGWHSARTIWNLRKLFVRETCIHEVGRNIQIGSVSPAGELVAGDTEGEWHNVPVSCPLFLQWTDSVTPLKDDWSGRPIHTLNNVSVAFRSRMNLAQPNLTHEQKAGPQLWGEQANDHRSRRVGARQQMLKPASIRGRQIKVSEQATTSIPLVMKSKV